MASLLWLAWWLVRACSALAEECDPANGKSNLEARIEALEALVQARLSGDDSDQYSARSSGISRTSEPLNCAYTCPAMLTQCAYTLIRYRQLCG